LHFPPMCALAIWFLPSPDVHKCTLLRILDIVSTLVYVGS
jgi:hypothetical protein